MNPDSLFRALGPSLPDSAFGIDTSWLATAAHDDSVAQALMMESGLEQVIWSLGAVMLAVVVYGVGSYLYRKRGR